MFTQRYGVVAIKTMKPRLPLWSQALQQAGGSSVGSLGHDSSQSSPPVFTDKTDQFRTFMNSLKRALLIVLLQLEFHLSRINDSSYDDPRQQVSGARRALE